MFAYKGIEMKDYKEILENLLMRLCLADHVGDVSNNIYSALQEMEIHVEWEELNELRESLEKLGWSSGY